MDLLKHPVFRFCQLLFWLSVCMVAYLRWNRGIATVLPDPAKASKQIKQFLYSPAAGPLRDRTEVRKGMTWGLRYRDTALGIDFLGCWAYDPEGKAIGCDAYHGDTPCSTALPILCVKVDGSARPPYDVRYPSRNDEPYYGGWLGGSAALSHPIQGTDLRSRGNADRICTQTLGAGWRMAEHHDGLYVDGMDARRHVLDTWKEASKGKGGWNFYAYTAGLPAAVRFWVAIDDQRAHCWD